ncbi:MAG: DinB family protein [Actinomycetota bacterium]
MDRPAPPHIPNVGDERTLLIAFLDFYRAALADRAFGLSDEQLQIALPSSSLTLSRLLGHMALVEQSWFRDRFDGEGMTEPWTSLDWEADADAEMSLAQTWSSDELLASFEAACEDSRRRVDGVGLDRLSVEPDRQGEHWNLRWILIHMIEEYARHCGHADLIRESIDGDVAG